MSRSEEKAIERDDGESGPEEGGRTAEGTVELGADPERVWRALTEGDELARWFPLEARVEPGEGGSIWMSWHNEYEGRERILRWDPPRHLRTTWGGVDRMQGLAQVTDYRLEPSGEGTVLRVVTSGFPEDASWDDWVEGTRRGWAYELLSLKHYLELHPGRERRVVYLRRRASGSREAAWRRLFGEAGLPARPLGGRTLENLPPVQYVAAVDEPEGGLLRVSTEPCGPGREEMDVTLFLSAWEPATGRLPELRREWDALLDRVFPETRDPDAAARQSSSTGFERRLESR